MAWIMHSHLLFVSSFPIVHQPCSIVDFVIVYTQAPLFMMVRKTKCHLFPPPFVHNYYGWQKPVWGWKLFKKSVKKENSNKFNSWKWWIPFYLIYHLFSLWIKLIWNWNVNLGPKYKPLMAVKSHSPHWKPWDLWGHVFGGTSWILEEFFSSVYKTLTCLFKYVFFKVTFCFIHFTLLLYGFLDIGMFWLLCVWDKNSSHKSTHNAKTKGGTQYKYIYSSTVL